MDDNAVVYRKLDSLFQTVSRTELLTYLSSSESDVNFQDKDGVSVTMMIAKHGNKNLLRVLLDAKANVKLRDKGGNTALHAAAYNGQEECVKELLRYGADVSIKSNDGYTAFDDAKHRKFAKIIKIFEHHAKQVLPNGQPRSSLYPRVREIGKGSFGKVYLCVDTRQAPAPTKRRFNMSDNDIDKDEMALTHVVTKVIDMRQLDTKQRISAVKEVDFLIKLKHDHIIRYEDHFMKRQEQQLVTNMTQLLARPTVPALESGYSLHIVMEYAVGGDLALRIKRQRHVYFDETVILHWFIELLYGLHYIHCHDIIHRDIKSSNIFLTGYDKIKIGDFGISISQSKAIAHAGTPSYMSPEMCRNEAYNGKSDVWSLGVVLYELCVLKLPFIANNRHDLIQQICTAEPITSIPRIYSPDIQRLVNWLLQKDHTKRPSVEQILADPWVSEQCRLFLPQKEEEEEEEEEMKTSPMMVPLPNKPAEDPRFRKFRQVGF